VGAHPVFFFGEAYAAQSRVKNLKKSFLLASLNLHIEDGIQMAGGFACSIFGRRVQCCTTAKLHGVLQVFRRVHMWPANAAHTAVSRLYQPSQGQFFAT
jgi:hypothetical protein